MEKTFFSTPELAQWLGVFHTTARRWIEQGKIRGIRVGRNYKIPVEEVIRVLDNHQIPLPDVLSKYKLTKKTEGKAPSHHPSRSGSILQKLLLVEEIEDPALVCRRNAILGANQTFADLVGHSQADLIGLDIAEVMDESSREKLIELTQRRLAHPGKGASDCMTQLKTEKGPRRKAKIAMSSLDHMQGVFLLVVRPY
ncbi:MAG: excisionase family DNA-binding protein [Planctomycetota bacterium]|jgi:excisionase family DNA binding protein/PAS domain S-box-containing protein